MSALPQFSERQYQLISFAKSRKTACFAGGAIRSGKTTGQVYGFALWSLKRGIGFDHCLVSQSVESGMRNVGFPLIEAYAELGVKAWYIRNLGCRIIFRYGGRENNIWVVGASDAKSRKRVQGATFKGVLEDELCNIPEDMHNMVLSRMSVPGSKLWATFNPEAPTHWVKRKVLDCLNDEDGEILHFTMLDNPGLAPEVRERYKRTFSGHFAKRFIDGVWAGASGLIYPKWHTADDIPNHKVKPIISFDFGLAGVFAALMFKRNTAVSEYVYDARESKTRTEGEHAEAIELWIKTHYPSGASGITVYADPSTPLTFKRLLRKKGMKVLNADNSVIPGIVTTATRLENADIVIGDCPRLKDELQSYAWDENKADLGEDAPIKSDDHACDALRYYAHTTGKFYRSVGQIKVNEAIKWH